MKNQHVRSKDGFENVLGLHRAPFGNSWGALGSSFGLLDRPKRASRFVLELSWASFARFLLPKMALGAFWGCLWLVLGARGGFLGALLVLLQALGGTLNFQNFLFGLPCAPILSPEESPTAPSGSPGALMARQMAPRSHQGSSGDVFGPIF